MKFELGKFYRTRDGRKAQIFMLDNGNGLMLGVILIDGIWSFRSWLLSSGQMNIGNIVSDCDLVSEWREPIIKAEKVFNQHLARFDVDLLNFFHDTLDGVMKSGNIKVTIEELPDDAP